MVRMRWAWLGLVAVVLTAAGRGQQVTLLRLSTPGGQPIPITATNGDVRITYTSSMSADTLVPAAIYVRVFRGRKAYLISQMPQYFKRGCVDYSSGVLSVNAGGQLVFRGLGVDWIPSGEPQYFTLVFEAQDAVGVGQSFLRLAKDARVISNYFNSGIEILLSAPGGYVPAQASVVSGPAQPVAVAAAKQMVDLPPCHTVTPYDKKAGGGKTQQAELRVETVPCGE